MQKGIESIVRSLEHILGDDMTSEELRDTIRLSNSNFGDLALPCHSVAKIWDNENNVDEIAGLINKNLKLDKAIFHKSEVKGPFINFFFNREWLINETLSHIDENYGSSDIGYKKKVIVDYSAPNIGKPLHIGHIRSTILGDSIIKILNKTGYDTHGINYLGDVGLHIGKLIWSYKRYVDNESLKKEPEKELLRLYAKFGEEHENYLNQESNSLESKIIRSPDDEDLEFISSPMLDEAKLIQSKLEKGDPELSKIYNDIYDSSLCAFDKIYSMLDVSFDEIVGQGRFSNPGKKIVKDILKGNFRLGDLVDNPPDGPVSIDLKKNYNLPSKVILRSDGAPIYSTQDIGAAHERFKEHNFDKMIYVVAEEQETYFKQIFSILDLLGNDWASSCYHLSFGMINLKEEKMSSRKGNVVFLEDVLLRSKEHAKKICKGNNLSYTEKEEISEMVGIGAIKYMVLSIDPKKSIQFSWNKAMNLNANSSPYIQYTYARANSLTLGKDVSDFNPYELKTDDEFDLVKKLSEYPQIVCAASERLKPNIIANYANDLAKKFNRFYHNHKILDSPQEGSRLYLTNCFKTVLKDSLGLLGIKVPEKM